MGFFSKKSDDVCMTIPPQDAFNDKSTAKENDGYIWVTGYKGTNQDMKCIVITPGVYTWNDIKHIQQYELGQRVVMYGEPTTCSRGFHFCPELKDVLKYYQYNFSNRYFAVTALVRERDYQKYLDGREDKLAAKEIELVEEVSVPFDILCDKNGYFTYEEIQMNKEEYEAITVTKQYTSPRELLKERFLGEMCELGFSNTFIDYLFDKMPNGSYADTVRCAKALHSQGVSNDMKSLIMVNKSQAW